MSASTDLSSMNVTQLAYERLRSDILSGRIAPGQKLVLADICEMFSINVSAAREALSRLSAEDLVIAEPKRGFRTAPVSSEDLRDLTEALVDIETNCLRRSIANGDLAWEMKLVGTAHQLSRLSNPVAQTQEATELAQAAHGVFHAALGDGCGVNWLLRLRETLYVQSERYLRLSLTLASPEKYPQIEHDEIVKATLERNADLAASKLATHIYQTTAVLIAKMDNPSEENNKN